MQFHITVTLEDWQWKCMKDWRWKDEHAERAAKEYLDSIMIPLKKEFSHAFYRETKLGGLVEFLSPDLALVDQLQQWMEKTGVKYLITYLGQWSIEEMARARWLALAYEAGQLDFEVSNAFPTLCTTCGWHDEKTVPNPYRIGDDPHIRKDLRKYELFPCQHGIIVVKKRVLDILKEVVSDQIHIGTIEIARSQALHSRSAPFTEELFWIRPRFTVGAGVFKQVEASCPACNQPLEYEDTPRMPWEDLKRRKKWKVYTDRLVLEHFGDPKLDIACQGNWRGWRSRHIVLRQVLLSGGLYAFLFNNNVKGLRLPYQGVYSAKNEPIIEARRRFDVFPTKKDIFLQQKMLWQESEEQRAVDSLPPEVALSRDKGVPGHVFRMFGQADFQVLDEIIPLHDTPAYIYVVKPTAERNFYTLITDGLSADEMNVPTQENTPKYAELILALPPEWKLDIETDDEDPRFTWPIAWLEKLVHYSTDADTFLAPGHTIASGEPPEPFAANTKFCSFLIRKPRTIPENLQVLYKDKDTQIHFYAAVPIYEDELRLHQRDGPEALEWLLEKYGVTELIDINRPSVVGR